MNRLITIILAALSGLLGSILCGAIFVFNGIFIEEYRYWSHFPSFIDFRLCIVATLILIPLAYSITRKMPKDELLLFSILSLLFFVVYDFLIGPLVVELFDYLIRMFFEIPYIFNNKFWGSVVQLIYGFWYGVGLIISLTTVFVARNYLGFAEQPEIKANRADETRCNVKGISLLSGLSNAIICALISIWFNVLRPADYNRWDNYSLTTEFGIVLFVTLLFYINRVLSKKIPFAQIKSYALITYFAYFICFSIILLIMKAVLKHDNYWWFILYYLDFIITFFISMLILVHKHQKANNKLDNSEGS
ncbi:MAG: hypothetical protein ACM3UZ_07865 [Acidobacteriota bacterium]